MKRYACTVCSYGYIPALGDAENGITRGTAFEDLPEDWRCPWCGAKKTEFLPEDEPQIERPKERS